MASKDRKIRRKVRNAYVVSTVSIALVLFLLGAVGYLVLNARLASDQLKENMTISVLLKDEVPDTERKAIEQRLTARPEVKEIRFISKDEAADDFKAYLGNDFVDFLDENPLPASYELTIRADYSHPDSLKTLNAVISGWEEIDDTLYQATIIEQVEKNIRNFNLILLFFGGTLLLISLILINNTIRITIFSKRSVINTMKLVGATKGFILRPFLWKSVAQGFWAALLAALMIGGVIYGLITGIPEAGFITDLIQLGYIFGTLVLLGIFISFLFTYWAVSKYIRLKSDNVFIY